MISFTTLLISLAGAAVFYFFFKTNEKKLNYPPGPFALPILGNVLSLSGSFHKKMCEWSDQYGDIYQLYFAKDRYDNKLPRVVIISDPKLIREAFNEIKFSGRAAPEKLDFLTGRPRGLINSDGEEWEQQRRFTLRHLRDFGFGKNYMEATIMEEVNELLDGFKKTLGEPTDVSRKFSLAVLNSLWQILASKRYKQDDPRLLKIANRIKISPKF